MMLVLFSPWLVGWCWWCLFLSKTIHGRYSPVFPPVPGSVLPKGIQPISQPPVKMEYAPPPLGTLIEAQGKHHHLDKSLVLSTALASAAVVLITLALFCLWVNWRENKKRSQKNDIRSTDSVKGVALGPLVKKFNSLKTSSKKGLFTFDYKLLESATNSFSDSNILGEGGFGCVYKATLEKDVIVAVKKLDDGGLDCEKEFENEMDLLSKIQHPNIISLLGQSVNDQTKFLVYELMQNGSLEMQLHGPSHGSALTWPIRMKIALDAARGLEYLHEHCNPPIIHRDLKSSNILLDLQFNAKISDFGLAVINGHQNKESVKLSGTLGYVAPEYLLDGKLTEKSDVYAFGVVLLELLLGRKPVEKMAPSQCQSIVTWAMPQLTDRSKLPNIVDPVLKDTMDLKHLYQVAAVAVLCVQPEPSYRPLITDVLHSLVPLVPVDLGGTLRVSEPSQQGNHENSHP